jgi:hypothetical protein
MKNYRITKYNPENRSSDGHYQVDEWTCPSEVGKLLNGSVFQKDEYFEIESKYIKAVIILMKSMSINNLRIVSLNKNYMEEELVDKDNQWLLDNKFKDIELFEDKSVDISEVETLIKLNLRNFMGCTLEIVDKFRLHFGYDYYMYISSAGFNSKVLDEIESFGLFVEELSHSINAPEYEFSVSSGRKDQEFIDDEYPLINISCDKIRSSLGFSNEHPCNHYYEITKSNCSIFEEQIDFNFDIYNYFLDCEEI